MVFRYFVLFCYVLFLCLDFFFILNILTNFFFFFFFQQKQAELVESLKEKIVDLQSNNKYLLTALSEIETELSELKQKEETSMISPHFSSSFFLLSHSLPPFPLKFSRNANAA